MDKLSIIRTIVLVIALVNQVLSSAGKSPLPIEDELVETLVSSIFTAVVSLWTWWKNNYISATGKAQKEALKKQGLYRP